MGPLGVSVCLDIFCNNSYRWKCPDVQAARFNLSSSSTFGDADCWISAWPWLSVGCSKRDRRPRLPRLPFGQFCWASAKTVTSNMSANTRSNPVLNCIFAFRLSLITLILDYSLCWIELCVLLFLVSFIILLSLIVECLHLRTTSLFILNSNRKFGRHIPIRCDSRTSRSMLPKHVVYHCDIYLIIIQEKRWQRLSPR